MNPSIRSCLRALPNTLSVLRLGLVPVLVALAWAGAEGPFLMCLVAGFASDVADGFVARRAGCVSELGARINGKMNSLQAAMKEKIASAAIPGFTWGSMSRRHTWKRLAPSCIPAISISHGTES